MKKLLIIVDYQNDFVDGTLGFEGADLIANIIKGKIEDYLNNNGHIIYTFDTHEEDYMNTVEGSKLPVPHCLKGTNGWMLKEEVNYLNKAIKIFEKPTFPSLELANYLKDNPYDVVELCGLVSNICVISNAVMVKSALPNAKIFIDALATDSFDKELQDKCFDVLEGLHIEVINRK